MAENNHVNEFLSKSNISVYCAPSISERTLDTCMCQECVIENYSKLKEKTLYSITDTVEILARTLKLYKTKTTHNFQFHCELRNTYYKNKTVTSLTGKMQFHIVYDEGKTVCLGDLDETDYGFSVEVPSAVIVDSSNKYLKENDKLVIQFRYRNFFYPRDPICRSGISRKKDTELLSKDLLSLYESKKFTDFAIIDQDGKKHHVHKWICKSRSSIINSIKDENVAAVTVEGKSPHVEIAIRYMYGGILPVLPVDDLLSVLLVAEELDIKFLILSVKNALLESLNKSNALKIHKMTINCADMHEVADFAKELLPEVTEKKRRRR